MSFLKWIIGLLVLWSGVTTARNVSADPGVGTTTSNETSVFIISIEITSYSYNDSLEDPDSPYYKTLRQKVEALFSEVFNSSSQYQKITEITFSNGSVIANCTVIFGSNQIREQQVKTTFVTNYEKLLSPLLKLNNNYTADMDGITPTPPHQKSTIFQTTPNTTTDNSVNSSSTSPHHTISPSGPSSPTEHPNTTTIFTASPSDTAESPNRTISTMSASASSNATESPNSTNSTVSTSSSSNTTENPNRTISATMSTSRSPTTTVSPSNISTISASTPSTTSDRSSSVLGILTSSSSTTTINPRTISGQPASTSSTQTEHATSKISAIPAHSSSVNPGKTVSQKPTGPEESNTVATEQGVPGWGIAILVLAAIILFFMLILLILLLLFWCCWWRQRGFMKVSDPDPTGYYNPDIPMYSTHSTYDSHNGKSMDANSERPKNQTGTNTGEKVNTG